MTENTKTNRLKTHGSLISYTIGFILSLVLTLAAYTPVYIHISSGHIVFSHETLGPLVLIFAIIQLFVQLFFFLHITKEEKPHWNLIFLLSTFSVILIVVIGSLWIMKNLEYHTPKDIETHVMEDELIYK